MTEKNGRSRLEWSVWVMAAAIALLMGGGSLSAQTNLWTSGSGGAIYYSGGNVGIGTTSPTALTQVGNGPNFSGATTFGVAERTADTVGVSIRTATGNSYPNPSLQYCGGSYCNYIGMSATSGSLLIGNGPGGYLGNSDAAAVVSITASGSVGIGTTNPQNTLSVNGTIQAKEVLVNTGWSDYVFDPSYHLRPLSEVAAYIEKNHHLPDMPSAADVEKSGVPVGEIESKLLAKVEELTLHIIDADRRGARLEEQNASLQTENERIRAKLARLESAQGARSDGR